MKFSGELKFPEVDHPGVPVHFVIEDLQAELVVDGESLGRWSLYDLHARRLVANAFQIDLDGTEVTFVANDPVDFAYRGVEHMAETWATIKSKRMASRAMAVRRSRKGTIPSRIEEMRAAMEENLGAIVTPRQLAGEVVMPEDTPVGEGASGVIGEEHDEPVAVPADVAEQVRLLEEERRQMAEERAKLEEERRIAEQREADRIEAYRLEMKRLEAEREELRNRTAANDQHEPVTESHPEPQLEPEPHPEPQPELEAEAESEPESVSDPEPQPELEAEPELDPGAKVVDLDDLAQTTTVSLESDVPDPVSPALHRTEPEPAMAGAQKEKGGGLMGAVRAAFRTNTKDHEHQFIEAPGGIGITRYVCEECGYVSISV